MFNIYLYYMRKSQNTACDRGRIIEEIQYKRGIMYATTTSARIIVNRNVANDITSSGQNACLNLAYIADRILL